MSDLRNKVALVTGASSGIGATIVKMLLDEGMKVVGVARRIEKIQELGKGCENRLFAVKCDVTDQNDVEHVFSWIKDNLGPLHVLVNNAGVIANIRIAQAKSEDIKKVLDTNLFAVTTFTAKAIESMKVNGIDGSIININSVAGHSIIKFPGVSVYQASKFGVTAFTEAVRKELAESGSKIRIASVSPGVVASEMTAGFIEQVAHLQSKDIANVVTFILKQPPEVQITELTIRPTGELV